MSKQKPVWRRLEIILERQESLHNELTSLAPKECADVDTTNTMFRIWQNALLAVNAAIEPLEDLAVAAEFYANRDALADNEQGKHLHVNAMEVA
jgi:hypothetical protein